MNPLCKCLGIVVTLLATLQGNYMPTGSYLTALIKAKQARLNKSSIRSILLALDIEDGCRQVFDPHCI